MDYKLEYEELLKRFRHLLESDFIRSFDEWDPRTNNYKKDIKDADILIKKSKSEIVVDVKANGLDEIREQLETLNGLSKETRENFEKQYEAFKKINNIKAL